MMMTPTTKITGGGGSSVVSANAPNAGGGGGGTILSRRRGFDNTTNDEESSSLSPNGSNGNHHGPMSVSPTKKVGTTTKTTTTTTAAATTGGRFWNIRWNATRVISSPMSRGRGTTRGGGHYPHSFAMVLGVLGIVSLLVPAYLHVHDVFDGSSSSSSSIELNALPSRSSRSNLHLIPKPKMVHSFPKEQPYLSRPQQQQEQQRLSRRDGTIIPLEPYVEGEEYINSNDRYPKYKYEYYMTDDNTDDFIKTNYKYHPHLKQCQKTAFSKLKRAGACNSVHELEFLNERGYYLSKGSFRQVLAFDAKHTPVNKTPYVMKVARYNKKRSSVDLMEMIHMDATIMDELTSNPAIVDIYGYCGFTVVTERLDGEAEDIIMPGEQYMKHSDLNDKHDVDPQNKHLSPSDKLIMAYEMAQGVAALHGYVGGVISHDDHRLCQYLRSRYDPDTDTRPRIKLNDFNRAQPLLWNEEQGEYCKYENHGAHGNHRSPEEYNGDLLTQQIDVYGMGNNIYSLLTGLDVYYEDEDDGVAQGFVKEGTLPFIDPRYRTRTYAEGQLVKVMERCWVYEPEKRADIFEVLNALEEAVEEDQRRRQEQKNS